jgi:hypothetical protein
LIDQILLFQILIRRRLGDGATGAECGERESGGK